MSLSIARVPVAAKTVLGNVSQLKAQAKAPMVSPPSSFFRSHPSGSSGVGLSTGCLYPHRTPRIAHCRPLRVRPVSLGGPPYIPEDRAPGFDRGYLWPHALMRSHTACVSRTHKRWLLERSRWPPASDKKFFGRSEPARVHSYRVHPPTVLLPHVGAVSIIGPGPGR